MSDLVQFGARSLKIEDIISNCRSTLLPDDEFRWIGKDNPRLYRWAAFYLILNKDMRIVDNCDYRSCYEGIVNFFDDRSNLPARKKINMVLITELKTKWRVLASNKVNLSWLDERNKEQCKWAWDYLYKKQNAYLPFESMPPNNLYDYLITSIDLWAIHSDTKTLRLMQMNKAWNQKKQRDLLKGKKSCNFFLSIEVKEKLEIIAKNNNLKQNKTLEWLINSEYEKTNGL